MPLVKRPERRFEDEGSLGFFSSNVLLLPPSELHRTDVNIHEDIRVILDNCHIYAICRRPFLCFDPETFVYRKDVSKGDFLLRKKGTPKRVGFTFRPEPPEGGKVVVSEYPHRSLLGLDANGRHDRSWPASVIASATNLDDRTIADLEVLYIGQSYGSGSRRAIDRLRNHETLQKVLSALANESPDDEILILMLEYEPPMVVAMFDPSGPAKTKGELSTQHITQLLTADIPEREKIGLIEAGLIRYFKPPYNKKFAELFPLESQKVLRRCYDLDFTGLTVEINTEDIFLRLFSERRSAAYHHLAAYDLHDVESRQSFFGIQDKSGEFVKFDMDGPVF